MKAAELRQAILQAAVQGKLVPQNPKDEPASELLKRIQQEKTKLIRDGKIKKEKPLPSIKEEEFPFDLPNGWEWCRLGTITLYIATGPFGSMLHKSDYVSIGIPLVNPANMRDGRIIPSDKMMISESMRIRMKSYILRVDDIVIARRGELGRCAVVTDSEDGWVCGTGSFFLRLSSPIFIPYFITFFQSAVCKDQLIAESVGSTMNNLNHTIMNKTCFPLPPLEEQHRIVAKVNELMSLCDELEAAETELNTLEDRFAEYLPKSILQAAVQGKLVEQDGRDEPATELLKRIRAEKAKLIKEGKIKKEKPLSPIAEDEIPYELPDGWVWCRLGEILINYDSKRQPVSVEYRKTQEKVYDYYGATGAIDKVDNYLFDGTYLLIGEDGGNFFVSRNVAFVVSGKFWANNHVHVLSFNDVVIEYICGYLNALDLPSMGLINGIAVPKLNQSNLNSIVVPIPPISEQQRIVTKVEELMSLCGELSTARTSTAKIDSTKVITFPQRHAVDEYEDIAMAARGDGSGPASDKLRQAIGDWDDEDE